MKPVVGVVGLGAMGSGMAQSLRRAGFELKVFDVRAGVAEAFAQDGGTACASAAELAAGCDVLVSVVVNAAQTEDLLFGSGAVRRSHAPGQRVRDVLHRRPQLVDRARSAPGGAGPAVPGRADLRRRRQGGQRRR